MKRIILIRHAKSSWKFDVIDHERPISTRGLNDANLVSNALKEDNLKIESVLSSDAVRTKSTLDVFINNLEIDNNIVAFSHMLYDFSGSNLIEVIKSVDDSINNLMLFGHNHAITHFVNSYGDSYVDNVPTCGVVFIEFDIGNWRSLKAGKIVKILFPRDLK